MLTNIYQETMDIDWFFTNAKHVGFVASGGGKLPDSVAGNEEENSLIASFFEELPFISDIIINPKLSKIIKGKVNDSYLFDFVNMAKKGIFAFDKTVLNNFSDLNYHLVASPVNLLGFETLPIAIKTKLLTTRYSGVFDEILSVGLVS